MKKFIIGFLLGSVLSGLSVWAALPSSITDREQNKFVEDSNGSVSVRMYFTN